MNIAFKARVINQSGRNNYSESEWRIIGGRPLFNKDCAVVVVSRVDYSREWTWMHPGIPLPFKQNATTRLVTDKEVAVIEKIVTRLPQPLVQYFVPYVGYYSYAVINMIKEISQAATALPETGPSKIGK